MNDKSVLKMYVRADSFSYLPIAENDLSGVTKKDLMIMYNNLLKQAQKDRDERQAQRAKDAQSRNERNAVYQDTFNRITELNSEVLHLRDELLNAKHQIDLMKKERKELKTEIRDARHNIAPMAY